MKNSISVQMTPPQNVTAVNKTSNSIFIRWDAALANQRQGEILGYKVNYSLRTMYSIEAKMVSVPTVHVKLTGLGCTESTTSQCLPTINVGMVHLVRSLWKKHTKAVSFDIFILIETSSRL